jgi:hypothetical protein
MAGKVFLCYRRDDSAGYAGRVQDRLEREFGRDLLFMDVDAIPLGVDFSKVLREEVGKCGVLLAVIGPNWLDARDKDGNRRLDDPHDFVRIEIGAALQRNIRVIPILLDGAKVPKANQLPTDLEGLSLRNGLDVRHASFHNDIDRLVRGLKGQLAADGAQQMAHGTRDAAPSPQSAQSSQPKAATKDDSIELALRDGHVTAGDSNISWPAALFWGFAVGAAVLALILIIYSFTGPTVQPSFQQAAPKKSEWYDPSDPTTKGAEGSSRKGTTGGTSIELGPPLSLPNSR